MLLSSNWLQNYVSLPETTEELEQLLTGTGLEVESVEDRRNAFQNIVVGEVLTCEQHPNADKLTVCTVSDGSDTHTVVCGAPNVAAGQKIIFARIGATMENLGFTIDRRKLRGVESAGMICSSSELGIDDNHDGIAVLAEDAVPGTPMAQHLGYDDVIFGIGITPNRGDALSHIGSARDIAAVTGNPLTIPEITEQDIADPVPFSVTITDAELCPRYSAAMLEGIAVQDSPAWLAAALTAVGIRPINNIVDVTNYVMMEIGQPMHAFDLDQLEGDAINVRPAILGERFVTLDDEKRDLPENALLICDAKKAVAIAGVMGGQNSAVSDGTTRILLESAYFQPSSVRKTAKTLQLSTDSSYRFERGTDPNITVWALHRAIALIQQTCGGTLRGIYDAYPTIIPHREVRLRPAFTNRILGIDVPVEEQRRILETLQVRAIEQGDGSFLCTIPTFRSDIEREIDLVEEIARIHGYDKIPVPTRLEMNVGDGFDDQAFPGRVREIMLGLGYDEILSSSLVPRAHTLGDETQENAAEVLNPVSKERPALRTSMLSSLLEAVDVNVRNGLRSLRMFEIGRVFTSENGRYNERSMLGSVISGPASQRSWTGEERPSDFFDLKGSLEAFLRTLYLDNETIFYYDRTSTLSEHVLTLEVKGRYAGQVVEVSDTILATFDIDQPVLYAELDIEVLRSALPDRQVYQPVAKYPSVSRDLAILIGREVRAQQIIDTVTAARAKHFRDVRIVDVFTHDSLGRDKKSVAFTMTFQSTDRTLKDKEISKAVDAILSALQRAFGAELRS